MQCVNIFPVLKKLYVTFLKNLCINGIPTASCITANTVVVGSFHAVAGYLTINGIPPVASLLYWGP
jgi:hypothetical protein